MDTKKLWEHVLGGIEIQVSKANFTTWFKDTYIHKISDGVVYLAVPNAFVRDWLTNKFHKVILKSLRDASPDIRSLEYSIGKAPERRHDTNHSMEQATVSTELPLQDLYVNREDNLNPRYTFETFVVGPFNELAHAAAQAVMKNPRVT